MGALAAESIPLHPDGSIVSQNPATGATLGEVPVASADEVRAAVVSARAAQVAWAQKPVKERARAILGFRDAITRRAEEIIELIVAEGGKTRSEALGMELVVVVDLATYFAKRAE